MHANPVKTGVPVSSAIAAYLPGAYFYDAWAISAEDAGQPALGLFLKALLATPRWIDKLMSMRNSAVAAAPL